MNDFSPYDYGVAWQGNPYAMFPPYLGQSMKSPQDLYEQKEPTEGQRELGQGGGGDK